jgi:hypothetical protein
MRCYTACCDGLPACTINAHTIHEARRVLTALIGDTDMTVRRATDDEAAAWRATASAADREKMQRLRKKNPGTTGAPRYQESEPQRAVV